MHKKKKLERIVIGSAQFGLPYGISNENGKTKEEGLSINEMELMEKIGMKNIVTSQRTNGFYAAIKKLKESV